MNRDIELTPEEKKAIASLKRLAKKWPKSLWLFSGSGFYVMKCGPDGLPVMTPGSQGSVDRDYIVTTIEGIHSDGGDW